MPHPSQLYRDGRDAKARSSLFHPNVTFPKTTALDAPVAVATFPGIRFQVSHANSAKATASLACASTPNSTISRTRTPSGSNPSRNNHISVAFFTPPPSHHKLHLRNRSRLPQMPPHKPPIRIHHRSRRQSSSRSHHIRLTPTSLPASRNKPLHKRRPKLLPPATLRRQGREVTPPAKSPPPHPFKNHPRAAPPPPPDRTSSHRAVPYIHRSPYSPAPYRKPSPHPLPPLPESPSNSQSPPDSAAPG